MTLVRVEGFWLNPDRVIGIWCEEIVAYRDELAYWRVTLRCDEGQVWYFKHATEEDAVRAADRIAHQINKEPVPWPVRDSTDDKPGGLR